MWFVMERVQHSFTLSERLIRVIHRSNSITSIFASPYDRIYAADTIEQLIADGADVNCPSGNVLPLQCACVVGDALCVKLLLKHGAKVNALDGYKRAPLHYAAEKCGRCVDLLLKHGACVDKRDSDGRSPLHWAASKNRPSCARRLLEAGADPDAADCHLDTPLSLAASKGHVETARVLLEYNCDVNAWNVEGRSPLCRAAQTAAESHVIPPRNQHGGGGGDVEDDGDSCLYLILNACGTICRTRIGNCAALFAQLALGNSRNSAQQNLRNNRMLTILDSHGRNARTLMQLCRYSIRRNLKRGHVPRLVADLPLPLPLKKYIALQN